MFKDALPCLLLHCTQCFCGLVYSQPDGLAVCSQTTAMPVCLYDCVCVCVCARAPGDSVTPPPAAECTKQQSKYGFSISLSHWGDTDKAI